MLGAGFEPARSKPDDLKSPPLDLTRASQQKKELLPRFELGLEDSKSSVIAATLQELKKKMLPGGFEPPTFGS